MPLTLTQSATAIGPGLTASFLANGGTGPYTYAVLPGGAGGSVDGDGLYTAPGTAPTTAATAYATVEVTDSVLATATAQVLVGLPIFLFCEVLQRELGLANGRVYLWDQKIMQPTDSDLYVAVSVPSAKPFSNVNRQSSSGTNSEQFISMLATLDVDIISRGPAARDRKEEVVLAFNSIYAQKQQEANSFYIAKLPPGSRFLNLSNVDGAAIPYRYRISVNIQYTFKKTSVLPYFGNFSDTIDTDP